MIKIIEAKTTEQFKEVRKLFLEYKTWLGFDLSFQSFKHEVSTLPGKYSPPTGAIFMAMLNKNIAGCIALRPLEHSICEMKRFFVRPQFRGKGIGRHLAEISIKKAKDIGYTKMCLDTHNSFKAAIAIYQSLGFKETAAYYDNPMPDISYWELDLRKK